MNASGAASASAGSNTFIRIAACGHTMAHLPQSMHSVGSQMGISSARARFSSAAVPVAKVPSMLIALTGRLSPRPPISVSTTLSTRATASVRAFVACSGTVTWARLARARSIARWLRSTMWDPRLPYDFSMLSLISRNASSDGRTSARAKKQGCMTVLMRGPRPAAFAIEAASITQTSRPLSITWCCTRSGRWSHTSSAAYGLLSSTVAPGRACASTSTRESRPNWWQATKSASSMRYDDRIGSGPNRRCDTVIEPDFFES